MFCIVQAGSDQHGILVRICDHKLNIMPRCTVEDKKKTKIFKKTKILKKKYYFIQVGSDQHGIHGILVRIRDDKLNIMPGCTVEDMGHKMGLYFFFVLTQQKLDFN